MILLLYVICSNLILCVFNLKITVSIYGVQAPSTREGFLMLDCQF